MVLATRSSIDFNYFKVNKNFKDFNIVKMTNLCILFTKKIERGFMRNTIPPSNSPIIEIELNNLKDMLFQYWSKNPTSLAKLGREIGLTHTTMRNFLILNRVINRDTAFKIRNYLIK